MQEQTVGVIKCSQIPFDESGFIFIKQTAITPVRKLLPQKTVQSFKLFYAIQNKTLIY